MFLETVEGSQMNLTIEISTLHNSNNIVSNGHRAFTAINSRGTLILTHSPFFTGWSPFPALPAGKVWKTLSNPGGTLAFLSRSRRGSVRPLVTYLCALFWRRPSLAFSRQAHGCSTFLFRLTFLFSVSCPLRF